MTAEVSCYVVVIVCLNSWCAVCIVCSCLQFGEQQLR